MRIRYSCCKNFLAAVADREKIGGHNFSMEELLGTVNAAAALTDVYLRVG